MKDPQKFLLADKPGRMYSTEEVLSIVKDVQLDAHTYKDRIINALFRIQDGEQSAAEKMASSDAQLIPGPPASDKRPKKSAPDAHVSGEEADAAPIMVAEREGKAKSVKPDSDGPEPAAKKKGGFVKVEAIPDVPADEPKRGRGRPPKEETTKEKMLTDNGLVETAVKKSPVTSGDEKPSKKVAPKSAPGKPAVKGAGKPVAKPAPTKKGKPAPAPKPPKELGTSSGKSAKPGLSKKGSAGPKRPKR